jgi:hypothetical protein
VPLSMTLTAITLDCPDPMALAAFYHQATGFELHPGADDDSAGLTREDGLFIGFQRSSGYQAPTWPDESVPQQLHLDFAVETDGREAGYRSSPLASREWARTRRTCRV